MAEEAIETTEEIIETEETPAEEVAEESPETAESAESKPKQTAQARIDEITYKFRESEREVEYWKNQANEPPAPIKTVAPQADPNRPNQENYETVEAYEDALFDWRDSKMVSEQSALAQRKRRQESASNFNKNATELRKEHPDFDKVIETPVFTDAMRNTLFEIDNGPMVAYHIAKNSDIADTIKDLSPERQVYEIAKLETKLLLAQKTKTTTTAPNPISPVGSTGAPEADPSKMSTEEWMAWEKGKELEKIKTKLEGG